MSPRIPPIHAWLLGWTLAAALLWRWLPAAPPWVLLALPLLLAWPNTRLDLGGWRLGFALVLLFLVIHGACAPPPRPPAARPAARPLADSARALLLAPLPQPALGLAALLAGPEEEQEAGRRPVPCAAWQRTGQGWQALPGRLEAWPHARRPLRLEPDSLLLVLPRPGAALWKPYRAPIGPFAPDPARRAWSRGGLGSLSLDTTVHTVLRLPARSASDGWRLRLDVALARLRAACARRLATGTGEGGPWLIAVLLGEQQVLPAEDVRTWQATGLAHLLAVSGLNVGVLALALGAGLSPLPRAWRDGLLALLLLLYVPMAGNQVSVRRAVVMALLLLAARRAGRPATGLSVLALAAVWILWQDPTQLASPGFQMSFGAVGALVLGLQPRPPAGAAARPHWLWRALRGVRDALRVTLLAQLGTLLSQLACFGALPLTGMLLNLVAVPLSSLLTVAGFLHLALPLPGEPLGALCRLLASWLVELARLAPVATMFWDPHPIQLALLAGACGVLLLPLARWRGSLRLGLAGLLCLAAADLLPRLAPRRVFACLFDVGQGDALLLQSPAGSVLVDAGWSNPLAPDTRGRQLAQAVGRLQPGGLDWLVLTHPDQDHLGGAVGLLEALPARRLLWNGEWRDNPPQQQLRAALASLGTPLTEARPGQLLQARPGWRLRVLGPPAPGACPPGNDRSIVLRAESCAGSLLLMGDAGLEEEARLASWGGWLRSDVLKAGHHGSRGSTGEDLLRAVQAREAWISCGRGNRYGHPHPELLERLRRAGLALRRSDQSGWLWRSLDGRAGPRRCWPRPAWRWRTSARRAPPV